ncbi:MAG: lytic polysaccharide monooxygenase, partial [Plesiomonas sp.]
MSQGTVLKIGAGSLLSLVTLLAFPQFAAAHGYVEYPAARQEFCDKDGGYWDSQDGSTIPNLACRQAYQQSSWYPFVQKPEFSRLVANYRDLAAVKVAIPDGTLCAGGDSKKSGIDLPSAAWKKTLVDVTQGGKMTVRFLAATPHNPSFWQFFLSKPGFDAATQKLAWADLEQVASFNDVVVTTIDGKKYYQMDIQLPTDRVGDAVLYTRWQRVDPAGEGFYNCSDITFTGAQPVATWINKGNFVKAGLDARAGETLWFRIFDAAGKEVIFEKLPVTAANEAEPVWAKQLADKVNTTYAAQAQVGVADSRGAVAYSTTDLYSNQVYTKNKDYTYQLDVRASNSAPVVTAPAALTVKSGQNLVFDVQATDAEGDKLTFSSSAGSVVVAGNKATVTYTAPVSTTDVAVTLNVTVSDGVNSVVTPVAVTVQGSGAVTPVQPKAWDINSTYQANDLVTYNGVQYKAQWWTKGETPGVSSVWLKVNVSGGGSTQSAVWSADIAYTAGQTVTYQGSSYKARWWTKG